MPTYFAPLVGMYFRPPAQVILATLPASTPLLVTPEPDNPHDPNAVAVSVASLDIPSSQHPKLEETAGQFGFSLSEILGQAHWHLGYIARDYAAALHAPIANDPNASAILMFDAKGKPQVHVTLEEEPPLGHPERISSP